MYDLLIYSLKVGACLAVFYLFFKLLLSRETFHRLNRVVVLGAMILSFVLPLCVITIERELAVMPEIAEVSGVPVSVVSEPLPEPFPWDTLAGGLFLLGAAVTLGWTLWSLAAVLRIVKRGRREKLGDGSVLVIMDHPVTPFSWGRYVVISEADYAENGCEIVIHEQAHLRMHHSFDLLVTDIAGCLQWFNPAMWLLRRELRAIHEYEADEAVLDSGADAKQYQLMLIKKAAGGRWYSVANSFNHSKLKNRITMMLRKKSSRWAGARTLLVLPLTALALGAFARTAYVFPDDKVKKENYTIHITGSDYSVEGVKGTPLYVVDGKEITPEAIKEIDPSRIKSIEILKDSVAKARYGDKAKDGVALVTLRKPGEPTPEPEAVDPAKMEDVVVVAFGKKPVADTLSSQQKGRTIAIRTGGESGSAKDQKVVWVIDGVETDPAKVNDLKPEQIASMSVYKDATVRAMFPGRDDIDGVIEVTTVGAHSKVEAALSAGHSGVVQAYQTLAAVREKLSPEEYKNLQRELADASQKITDAQMELFRQKLADAQLKGRVAGVSGMDEVVVVGTGSKKKGSTEYAVIYLDGKRITEAELKAFDPKNIDSIEVLKNGESTAQYGEEAVKKGVILITSKEAAKKNPKKDAKVKAVKRNKRP